MSRDELVLCPSCLFPNIPGASACLTCKRSLRGEGDGAETQERAADQLVPAAQAADTVRLSRGEEDPPTRPYLIPRREDATPDPPAHRRGDAAVDPAAAVVGWLECDPLPPIVLGPKRSVTMGRSKECDLILPHATVSRLHGVLRVLGRQLVYEDRSTFGSYLNGRQVSSAHLELGDTLAIGPYTIRILPPGEGSDEQELDEDNTQPLDFTGLRDALPAELMGNLDRISLAEILQQLEFNAKTGTLEVTCGRRSGRLGLRQGRPVSASLGPLTDDAAVLAMLRLTEGSFAFRSDRTPEGEPSMRATLTGLLLEASRQMDEGG